MTQPNRILWLPVFAAVVLLLPSKAAALVMAHFAVSPPTAASVGAVFNFTVTNRNYRRSIR
jgi:hypothetical protein